MWICKDKFFYITIFHFNFHILYTWLCRKLTFKMSSLLAFAVKCKTTAIRGFMWLWQTGATHSTAKDKQWKTPLKWCYTVQFPWQLVFRLQCKLLKNCNLYKQGLSVLFFVMQYSNWQCTGYFFLTPLQRFFSPFLLQVLPLIVGISTK